MSTRTVIEPPTTHKSGMQSKQPKRYEEEMNTITSYFSKQKNRKASKLLKVMAKAITEDETSENTEGETGEGTEGETGADTEGEIEEDREQVIEIADDEIQ